MASFSKTAKYRDRLFSAELLDLSRSRHAGSVPAAFLGAARTPTRQGRLPAPPPEASPDHIIINRSVLSRTPCLSPDTWNLLLYPESRILNPVLSPPTVLPTYDGSGQ
jgi:hypothetical protein